MSCEILNENNEIDNQNPQTKLENQIIKAINEGLTPAEILFQIQKTISQIYPQADGAYRAGIESETPDNF